MLWAAGSWESTAAPNYIPFRMRAYATCDSSKAYTRKVQGAILKSQPDRCCLVSRTGCVASKQPNKATFSKPPYNRPTYKYTTQTPGLKPPCCGPSSRSLGNFERCTEDSSGDLLCRLYLGLRGKRTHMFCPKGTW